jgi:NADH-quinone oxidoreductase subunit E
MVPTMLPNDLKTKLADSIAAVEYPREQAIDVMLEMQEHYGYMSDEAMAEAAVLLGMTTLELEELATFYDFIYRSPVGKHVIRVCDSALCWMEGHLSIIDHICSRLNLTLGGTTADGLFTLLPVCCIGYCDRAPAMMIDKKVYGKLTPEKMDRVLNRLIDGADHQESE